MNKIYTLTLSLLISASAFAQWDVPNENKGLITKITATWCGPCGGWGWDNFNDLITEYKGDHILTALYASSSSGFYNEGCQEMADEIGFGGYPNFAGNGLDVGTSSSAVNPIVDTFASDAPTVANVAYEVLQITKDSIFISTKTKFFENLDGSFKVIAFVIEDHPLYTQAGHTGEVEHHMVHQGNFSPTNGGPYVTTDGASAGEEITRNFSMAYNSEWDIEHLYIATTLWVEDENNPDDLLYVNGTDEPQAGEIAFGGSGETGGGGSSNPADWPVGVEDVESISFDLYPNPATDQINLKLNMETDYSVMLTDLLGKTVYSEYLTASTGTLINVNDIPEGVYMIKIKTEDQTYFDRVVVK